MAAYVDTSALAKMYLREAGSDAFEDWIRDADDATISSLTIVEMRSLLARRRRMAHIDAETERRCFACFRQHVDARLLAVEPVRDPDVQAAPAILDRLPGHAVRTLDAIHLSLCVAREIPLLATADAIMAAAAEELGIEVVSFA